MADTQQTWIQEIQAEAERITKKRLKDDADEQARLEAEQKQELADDRKKA